MKPEMPTIGTDDLLRVLQQHGISAMLVGKQRSATRFCSLRAPEAAGLYYATTEIKAMPALSESIIVCDAMRNDISLDSNSLLVTSHPQRAFYLLQRAYQADQPKAGVHPTAVVSDQATIDPSAHIGPFCVIGKAEIGPNCNLESHVVVRDDVVLEKDVTIESHSTLGATGVAWVWDETNSEKIVQPQTGGVRVGEGTFIGTDVTIVRGSINEITSIGANCLIAHGTKIGHSCRIGDLVHFANNVTIAGSVTIGRESFMSSGSVVRPRVTLPRGTTVGAGAVVITPPEDEFVTVVGFPAKPVGTSKSRMTGVPFREQQP